MFVYYLFNSGIIEPGRFQCRFEPVLAFRNGFHYHINLHQFLLMIIDVSHEWYGKWNFAPYFWVASLKLKSVLEFFLAVYYHSAPNFYLALHPPPPLFIIEIGFSTFLAFFFHSSGALPVGSQYYFLYLDTKLASFLRCGCLLVFRMNRAQGAYSRKYLCVIAHAPSMFSIGLDQLQHFFYTGPKKKICSWKVQYLIVDVFWYMQNINPTNFDITSKTKTIN